jgi:GWxTD domain-containing protein
MRAWVRQFLSAVLVAGLAFPSAALALPQEKQEKEKPQETDKERKKREKAALKEIDNLYKSWLNDEVGYIISDEERTAFLRLGTNEEREQFIESFWGMRDPTPDTVENEFKEEHYRRIAYSNERFASGIPGWRTDRGRIYIIWGPPDEVESHPSGGSYVRPYEEGGGTTSTFPFEKWRYRHLEGIGSDIILEFVDPSGSSEYRLTMDPSEKDALLMVPGAGLSELEAMGIRSKTDRFTRSDGTRLPTVAGGVLPERMNQFTRLEQYAKVQRPPALRFKELEEVVTSRLVRSQVSFDYRFDFLRVTGETVLVPITVQIPNKQMTYKNDDGVHTASLNLFARITTLTGRRVQVFEDVITREFPESLLQQSLKGFSIYQKAVPLRPGLYRLDIVIKDVNSGNVGVVNTRLPVPRYDEQKLATSTLILADLIERVPAKNIGLGQFVIGATKVRPRMDSTFSSDDSMGIFLQVYNLGIDETTKKPSASLEYRILKGDDEIHKQVVTSDQVENAGEQLTLEQAVALNAFQPGRYKLQINVTDNITKQTIASSADFTVKAAEKTSARK